MRTSMIWILGLVAAAPLVAEPCQKKVLGGGVTLAEATPVASILAEPESFVGKELRVEGTVAEVCENAGCWMKLRAGEGDRVLKVKVKDGEIVFPLAARGNSAVAQGSFERLEMSRDKYVGYLKHIAEEQKKPFDEATVPSEGPFRIYQLKGTGAEVCI